MNKLIKTLAIVCIPYLCDKMYATPLPDPLDNIHIITLNRNDNNQGINHQPHRSPTKDIILPEIYFDASTNTFTFLSYESTEFTYTIYNTEETIATGTIQINEENTKEITISDRPLSGEYIISLEINGVVFCGYLYLQ